MENLNSSVNILSKTIKNSSMLKTASKVFKIYSTIDLSEPPLIFKCEAPLKLFTTFSAVAGYLILNICIFIWIWPKKKENEDNDQKVENVTNL